MSQAAGDLITKSRPLLSKLLLDPTWNLAETPNLLRLLRDDQNNVYIFPTVIASTRGGSAGDIVTVDISPIPQGVGGASSINASLLGLEGLSVNNMPHLFNGTNYDLELDYFVSRTTSAAATAQTVTFFKGNLGTHLSILCSAPTSTATLDVQGSVDNSNFIDLFSLATNVANTFDFVGTAPLSSTTAIGATDVSNPVTSGGAVTETTLLNPLAFPFLKVVAGAAGAGVSTVLTISVK